jgi:hypothetical protein
MYSGLYTPFVCCSFFYLGRSLNMGGICKLSCILDLGVENVPGTMHLLFFCSLFNVGRSLDTRRIRKLPCILMAGCWYRYWIRELRVGLILYNPMFSSLFSSVHSVRAWFSTRATSLYIYPVLVEV